MAELEIHHDSEHKLDPMGQKVGVLAALLAVGLAIVTIASHRTHTAAIIHKATANDDWAHYQATRVKYHNLELGEQLVKVFGAKGGSAETMLADYASQKKKYEAQGAGLQEKAQQGDEAAEKDEGRGLRYDIGEGLLEIALVVSSLYFISRKNMFPVLGVIAGIGGVVIAITGLFG
jgi:hypothetical protein